MDKKRVLILCTGNSCRSQMAEGALRHFNGDRFEAFSAGTKPSQVNPTAIKVMKEIGIDISSHRSKHVDEFKGMMFDHVITVCDNAKESCPIFPGVKSMHWPFPDPPHDKQINEAVLGEFRRVRDMICERFKDFESALGEGETSKKKKKGFIAKMMTKLDQKLEQVSKKTSCCGDDMDKGKGSKCC